MLVDGRDEGDDLVQQVGREFLVEFFCSTKVESMIASDTIGPSDISEA